MHLWPVRIRMQGKRLTSFLLKVTPKVRGCQHSSKKIFEVFLFFVPEDPEWRQKMITKYKILKKINNLYLYLTF